MLKKSISAPVCSVLFIALSSPAYSQAIETKPSGSDVIVALFLCGLMGLVGQGARAVVGLKTLSDYKPYTTVSDQDTDIVLFSLARLLTSLVIGFIAGVLTGLATWKMKNGINQIDVTDFDTMIKFAIAGYIGTDIIEAFTAKYFAPNVTTTLKDLSLNTGDTPPPQTFQAAQTTDLGPLLEKIDKLSESVDDIKKLPASTASEEAPVSDATSLSPLTLASFVIHTAEPPLLGSLSSKYEVGNRGPGTVSGGVGDPGGPSYGSYQMTSRHNGQPGGTVDMFVVQLPPDKKKAFAGLSPGSDTFTAVWKRLAQTDSTGFFLMQHRYVQVTHYEPVCQSVADRVAISSRSLALQNVVWSTAVQHGPKTGIVALIVGRFDFAGFKGTSTELDSLVIKGIYQERGRRLPDGRLAYFTNSSPQVQAGVAQRFVNEQRDALVMLGSEGSSNVGSAQDDGYKV